MFSARSKVRGTLEIYHAYIRDSDTSRGDTDWEIVDNNSTNVSVSSVYLISHDSSVLSLARIIHSSSEGSFLSLAPLFACINF